MMVVVMMIPAIVVIVIAVRAVMMMVMMPPTVMVGSSVPDRLACRQWVKLRRTHCEQMFSALLLRADIAQCSRHVSKVPLATNAVQQITSYSITSSARAGVLPDRMSTPRRPDAGVPQRPRPAPDAHASLLKLPPPQIIFWAATPAPGLRPLV
jgi:hypothetical protein